MHDLAPTTQVSRWLAALDAALTQGDVTAAAGLFAAECYWRDLVAFTWNITTVEGQDGIGAMLGATLRNVRPSGWRIEGEATAAGGVTEGWFTFETAVARGRGHVRLVGDRSVTLLTTIAELKGHEERRGATRERGVEHGAVRNRKSWLDLRRAEEAALGATNHAPPAKRTPKRHVNAAMRKRPRSADRGRLFHERPRLCRSQSRAGKADSPQGRARSAHVQRIH